MIPIGSKKFNEKKGTEWKSVYRKEELDTCPSRLLYIELDDGGVGFYIPTIGRYVIPKSSDLGECEKLDLDFHDWELYNINTESLETTYWNRCSVDAKSEYQSLGLFTGKWKIKNKTTGEEIVFYAYSYTDPEGRHYYDRYQITIPEALILPVDQERVNIDCSYVKLVLNGIGRNRGQITRSTDES